MSCVFSSFRTLVILPSFSPWALVISWFSHLLSVTSLSLPWRTGVVAYSSGTPDWPPVRSVCLSFGILSGDGVFPPAIVEEPVGSADTGLYAMKHVNKANVTSSSVVFMKALLLLDDRR